ncbi:MAG: hypothetical protein NZL89_02255 [Leptospiraceae bacterium]|nr:hypothetical protein [Leptospiraceae bacterium]
MDEKRKTSISLPVPAEGLCHKHYAFVMANLALYLRYLRRHPPSRQKLRTHNDGSEGITIVQVYWDMETYGSLHTLAFSLRWSVSHLVFVMLCLAEEGVLPGAQGLDPADQDPIFSNCDMKVKMWGAAGYIYTEFLRFSSSKPLNTTKPVAQNGRK